MPADRRQFIAAAGAAGLLAACGQNSNAKAVTTGDIALGAATAPVTMIEYASTMCPHCAEFHEVIFPGLKQKYIDTGKLRFVFREFATEPREFAYAGFMIARCVGDTPQKYYDMLGVFFEQQRPIFEAARVNQGREKLLDLSKAVYRLNRKTMKALCNKWSRRHSVILPGWVFQPPAMRSGNTPA